MAIYLIKLTPNGAGKGRDSEENGPGSFSTQQASVEDHLVIEVVHPQDQNKLGLTPGHWWKDNAGPSQSQDTQGWNGLERSFFVRTLYKR